MFLHRPAAGPVATGLWRHNRALFNRELSGATVYDGHGRLSSRSNKHRDEAGDNKRDSPCEIKIKPGSLQDAHPEFFIDDHRNEPRDQQVPQGVNNDRDCGQPGMVQEIEIRPMRGMRAERCMGVVDIFSVHGPKKNGHEHETRSVRRGHQKRP